MVVRELIGVLLRRWYVLVVVMALAAGGSWALHRDSGLYTTRTVVSFMLPQKTQFSLDSGLDDVGVIAFASMVAQVANNGKEPPRYSTDDAPYYGAGVRQGVLITVPNAGNQWVTSYLRAEVVVQIVGPTEQWVDKTQAALLKEITQIAQAEQVDVHPAGSRIQTDIVPLTTRIFHVTPTRSAEIMAYSALMTAALIVGVWGSVVLDGTVSRKRKRRNGIRRTR